ncbi:alpha/beta-hydrolase [Leucosporidium creatinivorum]|uniref:Carboxylic ester hydrolase n=1 Tax=Leucosporidium creatinivorum TaxID=106004 RepID=A0A1Y2FY02_9BASI|nr:alpha/beta-hydrolase [Leucosporidium creatinivorum]
MLLPPLLALLSAASSLASPLSKRDPTSPTVTIKNGTLVGRYEALLQQELFLNTPYARPPIGDLRLANPLYYNISWSSPRSAKSWGNVCPGSGISSQNNASLGQDYNLNEDCLNINIIRPEGAKEGDELPVLFWIFGGGFIQGTANDPRYNGSYLVQRSVELGEPIVRSSCSYRLTGFGFPAGQPAADAGVLNLGLKDQRLALHWVQENIAAFGGSPGKVTIWGQSAGGMSVTQQMLAYGGRDDGLFRAAIINSGIFAAQNRSVASQEKAWQSFLNSTSCTDVSTSLSCLRALPYETYYSALVNSSYNPAPIPDGDFITQSAVNAIKEGKIVNKNVLISATRDEATSGIGAPVGLQNETAFRSAVTFLSSTNSTSQLNKISELYPDDPEVGCPFNTGDGVASSGLMDKRINALITDQLHAGSRYFAQLHSSLASTWSSRFHQVPQNQSIELGVSHANELPYIFGVLNRTIRTPLGTRKADEETSKLYQTYILNFVNYENPNGASDGSPNELYWPRHDEGQENLIFQNGKTRVEKDDYRKEGQEYLIELATGQA